MIVWDAISTNIIILLFIIAYLEDCSDRNIKHGRHPRKGYR